MIPKTTMITANPKIGDKNNFALLRISLGNAIHNPSPIKERMGIVNDIIYNVIQNICVPNMFIIIIIDVYYLRYNKCYKFSTQDWLDLL